MYINGGFEIEKGHKWVDGWVLLLLLSSLFLFEMEFSLKEIMLRVLCGFYGHKYFDFVFLYPLTRVFFVLAKYIIRCLY